MPSTQSSSPDELAAVKVVGTLIGLVVLFLAPLGFLAIAYKAALALLFPEVAIVFTTIAGFILGLVFPILAIDAITRGKKSFLSTRYRTALEAELQLQDSSSIHQLRKALAEVKAERDELLLARDKPHQLGSWRVD